MDFNTIKAGQSELKVDAVELGEMFRKMFSMQVYQPRMKLVLNYKGTALAVTVESLEHADLGGKGGHHLVEGQLLSSTLLEWEKASGSTSPLRLTGIEQEMRNDSMFKSDFDFEKMGIGGSGRRRYGFCKQNQTRPRLSSMLPHMPRFVSCEHRALAPPLGVLMWQRLCLDTIPSRA